METVGKPYGIIYLITCLVNMKGYVGQTIKTMEERWSIHLSTSTAHRTEQAIHRAIRKYGAENFTIKQVCECDSKEILNIMETFYIMAYNTYTKQGKGYNMTWGGDGSSGRPCSEVTRKKIGDANRGRVFTSEALQKMSDVKKGKHHTEEEKSKISRANKGRKFSDEHREKIRIAATGRKDSAETSKKRSESQKARAIKCSTWWYTVEFTNGKKYEGPSMGEICTSNNLIWNSLRKRLDNPEYGMVHNGRIKHQEYIGCKVTKVLRTDR